MAESISSYLIECPICMERLYPPVDTCIRGHAVCRECRQNVTNCPTCRGEFSANQNVLLNQMLESIQMDCKYNSSGYEERMVMKEIIEHEKNCFYKENQCCICHVKGIPYCELNDHFSNHSNWVNALTENLFQTFRIELDITANQCKTFLIFLDDQKFYFLLRFKLYGDNKLILCIQSTDNDNDANDYFYEMRIDQKLPYKGCRSVFTFNGFCIPYSYSSSDWTNHKRAVTLDLKQIFLKDVVPEKFPITFQIKNLVVSL